jgi:hypothetical protein
VEGAEDMDLEKEDRDAEVPTAEVNKTMGNPWREVPILLTPCGGKTATSYSVNDQRSKKEFHAVKESSFSSQHWL